MLHPSLVPHLQRFGATITPHRGGQLVRVSGADYEFWTAQRPDGLLDLYRRVPGSDAAWEIAPQEQINLFQDLRDGTGALAPDTTLREALRTLTLGSSEVSLQPEQGRHGRHVWVIQAPGNDLQLHHNVRLENRMPFTSGLNDARMTLTTDPHWQKSEGWEHPHPLVLQMAKQHLADRDDTSAHALADAIQENHQVPENYSRTDYGEGDSADLLPMFHAIPPNVWRGWNHPDVFPSHLNFTPRLATADLLDELGRHREAAIMRDTRRHAYLHNGGQVHDASDLLREIQQTARRPGYGPAGALDAAERQYLDTALWSSMDETAPNGGYPLDQNFNAHDIDMPTMAAMVADWRHFNDTHAHHLTNDQDNYAPHDFWLTRNGHGVGFPDRPEVYGDAIPDLTGGAKRHGEYDLYLHPRDDMTIDEQEEDPYFGRGIRGSYEAPDLPPVDDEGNQQQYAKHKHHRKKGIVHRNPDAHGVAQWKQDARSGGPTEDVSTDYALAKRTPLKGTNRELLWHANPSLALHTVSRVPGGWASIDPEFALDSNTALVHTYRPARFVDRDESGKTTLGPWQWIHQNWHPDYASEVREVPYDPAVHDKMPTHHSFKGGPLPNQDAVMADHFRHLQGETEGENPDFDFAEEPHEHYGRVNYDASEADLHNMLTQLASPEHNHTRWGHANGPMMQSFDETFRNAVTDALRENNRHQEADWLQDPNRHVLVENGKILPARFTDHYVRQALGDHADAWDDVLEGYPGHSLDFLDLVSHGEHNPYPDESFVDPYEHDPDFMEGPGEVPPNHVRVVTGLNRDHESLGHFDTHISELGNHLADELSREWDNYVDWSHVDDEDAGAAAPIEGGRRGELDRTEHQLRNAPYEEVDHQELAKANPLPQQEEETLPHPDDTDEFGNPTNNARYGEDSAWSGLGSGEWKPLHYALPSHYVAQEAFDPQFRYGEAEYPFVPYASSHAISGPVEYVYHEGRPDSFLHPASGFTMQTSPATGNDSWALRNDDGHYVIVSDSRTGAWPDPNGGWRANVTGFEGAPSYQMVHLHTTPAFGHPHELYRHLIENGIISRPEIEPPALEDLDLPPEEYGDDETPTDYVHHPGRPDRFSHPASGFVRTRGVWEHTTPDGFLVQAIDPTYWNGVGGWRGDVYDAAGDPNDPPLHKTPNFEKEDELYAHLLENGVIDRAEVTPPELENLDLGYARETLPTNYAATVPARAIHPRLRNTRLGALLRSVSHQEDTLGQLARDTLLHPADDPYVDNTKIAALQDWLLDNPEHPLTQKFRGGGQSLLASFALDQAMHRAYTDAFRSNGADPPVPGHWMPIWSDALQGNMRGISKQVADRLRDYGLGPSFGDVARSAGRLTHQASQEQMDRNTEEAIRRQPSLGQNMEDISNQSHQEFADEDYDDISPHTYEDDPTDYRVRDRRHSWAWIPPTVDKPRAPSASSIPTGNYSAGTRPTEYRLRTDAELAPVWDELRGITDSLRPGFTHGDYHEASTTVNGKLADYLEDEDDPRHLIVRNYLADPNAAWHFHTTHVGSVTHGGNDYEMAFGHRADDPSRTPMVHFGWFPSGHPGEMSRGPYYGFTAVLHPHEAAAVLDGLDPRVRARLLAGASGRPLADDAPMVPEPAPDDGEVPVENAEEDFPTDYGVGDQPTNARGFWEAINADPLDSVNHHAFADWLEEQGHPDEAAFRRSIANWMQTNPPLLKSGHLHTNLQTGNPESRPWIIPGNFSSGYYPEGVRGVDSNLYGTLLSRHGKIMRGQEPTRGHAVWGTHSGYSPANAADTDWGMSWPTYHDMENALRDSFLDGLEKQRQQEGAQQPPTENEQGEFPTEYIDHPNRVRSFFHPASGFSTELLPGGQLWEHTHRGNDGMTTKVWGYNNTHGPHGPFSARVFDSPVAEDDDDEAVERKLLHETGWMPEGDLFDHLVKEGAVPRPAAIPPWLEDLDVGEYGDEEFPTEYMERDEEGVPMSRQLVPNEVIRPFYEAHLGGNHDAILQLADYLENNDDPRGQVILRHLGFSRHPQHEMWKDTGGFAAVGPDGNRVDPVYVDSGDMRTLEGFSSLGFYPSVLEDDDGTLHRSVYVAHNLMRRSPNYDARVAAGVHPYDEMRHHGQFEEHEARRMADQLPSPHSEELHDALDRAFPRPEVVEEEESHYAWHGTGRPPRIPPALDTLPVGYYTRSMAPTLYNRTLTALLKNLRQNPYESSAHGVFADALEEAYPDSPVPEMIRRKYGQGQHTEDDSNNFLWWEPFYNSWDGTFPYTSHVGTHGPFDVRLAHEGAPDSHGGEGSNQRWLVHLVSRLPGSRDSGYTFEFPHEEAHLIPQLFPGASRHIRPDEHYDDDRRLWTLNHEPLYRQWIEDGADVNEDDPGEDGWVAANRNLIDAASGEDYRQTEAERFNDEMDSQENAT